MRSWTRSRERGAELVEAALVIPLLLIMLAIVVDLGRAYFTYIAVIDAAREGARTMSCGNALAEAQGQPLPVTLTCAASGAGSGTPFRVTVSCNLPLIMGFVVGRSSLLISYTAAFRIR
jgi:Flp pilus assembly protein TadG